ncbi:MAG: hypothetical protein AAGA43_13400 [Bacteroidota bacterium]
MHELESELAAINKILEIDRNQRKLITLKEASIYYNIKISTLLSWKKKNILPVFDIDETCMVHRDVFDAWLLGKFSWSNLKSLEEKIESMELSLNGKLHSINIPEPKNYSWALFFILLLLALIFFKTYTA